MANLTIRNVDNELTKRLRIRATQNGRSMSEEARCIIQSALETALTGRSLVDDIRSLVEPFGGIDMELPSRDLMREPPDFR